MPGGRPRKQIDIEAVEELASEGCTQEEIADVLGFSRSTFHNHKEAKEAYKRGIANLKISLRHWQVQLAKSGNAQMLVYLGKVILKQSEDIKVADPEIETEDDPITKSLKRKYGKSF